jgi:hypothetical protein
MAPLTRLAAAAASNGLLTGQILFSLAFVDSCELPNWIQAPREVNACRSRSPALALFFPSGMQTAFAKTHPVLDPGPAWGVPMSRPIPAGDDIEPFDPELPPVALPVCPSVSPSGLYRRQAPFTTTVAP